MKSESGKVPKLFSANKVRIVLVEDEPAHAKLVQRAFDSAWEDAEIVVALTLTQALAEVSENTPDLVIADFMLPDGKGTELLPGPGRAASFPIVIMTSQGDEKVAVNALKSGALDYVVKSSETLSDMPHIAERALREWGYIERFKKTEKALRSVVEGTSSAIGEHFFRDLVRNLAQALDFRYALVAEVLSPDHKRAKTLAVWASGALTDNFEYNISGTPCEKAISQEICFYSHGVAEQFPEDEMLAQMDAQSYLASTLVDSKGKVLGLLVVLDDKPMLQEGLAESLIKVFSMRASTELERLRAEKTQTLLSTAVEQATEIIVITDIDGSIEYINPAFEFVTGYSREEVLGLNPRVLKSGQHDKAFYETMWATLVSGKVWKGHFINEKKDGSLYEEEAAISPVRDANGKTTHFVAVKRDVTHEAELESQLRQTQKMEAVGTLAGGIAHDFNNILSAILGYSHMAMDCAPEGSELHEFVSEIFQAGQRATELVRQILTFSRRREQKRMPVSIEPIIREALKLMRASLPATIEICLDIAPDCPPVLADATQVHQVIINLCANAFHAMEKDGGTLTVKLEQMEITSEYAEVYLELDAGQYICLTITDTGLGMDEQTRQRIFEPYFTTKDEGKGTGLGLATVHGIMRSHGGTINVSSKPGNGTQFELYLPVLDETAICVPETFDPLPSGKGERILFVDDETTILDLNKRLLESHGYNVTTISTPTVALEMFRADLNGFDLVITDNTMPKMTGMKLAEELVALRSDIPIILISGRGDAISLAETRKIGILEVISKPLERSQFLNAVHYVLTGNN